MMRYECISALYRVGVSEAIEDVVESGINRRFSGPAVDQAHMELKY